MAEINKMFLPSTVRNKVISPLRNYQKKSISNRRTDNSPDQETFALPASMKRKGIRGRTVNSKLLPQTHDDLVRIDDNTQYRTVDMVSSSNHGGVKVGAQVMTDQSALRNRL